MSIDVNDIRQIGKYPVERFLAEGGMAWVFKIRDPDLFDAPRALKLLKPGAAVGEEFQRFMAEAKILATIQHPNLIHVYDFGQDTATGCHFYTMDFIEGETLADIPADWLKGGALAATQMVGDPNATLMADPNATQLASASGSQPVRAHSVRDVCEYFSGILSALARLHRERIVHRDIKPQNIFLTSDGIAILGDLGIAKGQEDSAGVTQAGRTPGTPLYMSPEHSLGDEVTERSDLFSIGLSLYRVLTGQTIYDHAGGVDSNNSNAVLRHLWQLHGSQAEFEFYFPDEIPEELREVIRRSCHLEQSERYRSAAEMNDALRDALGHLSRPGAEARKRDKPATGGRSISPGLIAALVAIPLLAVAGYFGWQMFAGPSPGRLAEQMQAETSQMGTRAEGLIQSLSEFEAAPSAGLLKASREEFKDGWEDARAGERDLQAGSYESAQRMFSRAQAGYSEVCQGLTSGFLEAASRSRVAGAEQARKAIPASAEKFAAQSWAELSKMMTRLAAEIPPAGCDRADALMARMDLSTSILAQSGTVQEDLGKRLPEVSESAIATAQEARDGAVALRSSAKEFKAVLALGDESLAVASKKRREKQYLASLEPAEQARVEFERATHVRPAEDARAAGLANFKEIEGMGLNLGSLRAQQQSALRQWERGEYEDAASSFGDLQSRSEEVVSGARKVEAAKGTADAALDEAAKLEVPVTMLAISKSQYSKGEIALKTWEFQEAEDLFLASLESSQKAMRDASESGNLAGGRNDEAMRKLEERLRVAEEERNRAELERVEERERIAAEREQERRELAEREAALTEGRRLAEQRAQDRRGGSPGVDQETVRRKEEQRLARLELDRQKADFERQRREFEAHKKRQQEERAVVIPAPGSSGTPANPYVSVMKEYEAAFEARDMGRLSQVYAMSRLVKMEMGKMFDNCDQVSVFVDLGEAKVTSSKSATMEFEQHVKWAKCRDRKKVMRLSGDKTAKFTLRGGSDWQIKKIYDR